MPGESATAQTSSGERMPGESGAWVFFLADMTVFALFFHVFLYYRADDPALSAASQDRLNPHLGAANTLLLLTSSWCVVVGMRAAARLDASASVRWLVGGLACGVGFCAVKIYEYADKIGQGLTPRTNEFFTYYFVFTGVHFLHVLIGCGVLLWMISQARRLADGRRNLSHMETGACFWHMVDLLWIVLFPLIYLCP